MIKIISIIAIISYTLTTPAAYPKEYVSALRPLCVKNSGSGNPGGDLAKDQSSAGSEVIKISNACYEKFLVIWKKKQTAAIGDWGAFLNNSKTSAEMSFLEAAFAVFGKGLDKPAQDDFKKRIKAGKTLAGQVGDKDTRLQQAAAVQVTLTNAGYVIGDEVVIPIQGETVPEKPSAAAEPGAKEPGPVEKPLRAPEGLQTHIAKDTLAEPGPTADVTPDLEPAPTKVSDEVLARHKIPKDKITHQGQNKLRQTLILTEVKGKKKLYVIKPDGGLLTQGPCFAYDKEHRFFVYGAGKKLCRYRFEDSVISELIEITENRTIYAVIPFPNRSGFLVYLRENKIGAACLYDIAAGDISKPFTKFPDIGEPKQIVFSEDGQQVTFRYDKTIDVIVNIQGHQLVSVRSAAPTAAKEKAKAEETKAVQPATGPSADGILKQIEGKEYQATLDDVKSWLALARDVKPFNEGLFDAIKRAVDDSSKILIASKSSVKADINDAMDKAKQRAGAATDAAAAAGIKLAPASTKPQAEDEITLAEERPKIGLAEPKPAATETKPEEKPIDLDTLPAEDIFAADEPEGKEEERISDEATETAGLAERLQEFLIEAAKSFRIDKTPAETDETLKRWQEKEFAKNTTGVPEELEALSESRKEELQTLEDVAVLVSTAIDSAIAAEIDKSESFQKYLLKVKSSFDKSLSDILSRFESHKASPFYRAVVSKIKETAKPFVVWYGICAGTISPKTTTFSALARLEKQMNENLKEEEYPQLSELAKAFIEKRKGKFTKKRNQALGEHKLIIENLCQEYMRAAQLLKEYDGSIGKMRERADQLGFDNLRAAGKAAARKEKPPKQWQEEPAATGVKRLIRLVNPKNILGLGKQLFKNPWEPFREALNNSIERRGELVKQLKNYAIAREIVLHRLKPGDICVSGREFDDGINSVVLQKRAKHIKKIYKPTELEKHIRHRDETTLKPLSKRFKIKVKRFKLLPEDFLQINDKAMQKYMKGNNLLPAAAPAAAKPKVSAAVASKVKSVAALLPMPSFLRPKPKIFETIATQA